MAPGPTAIVGQLITRVTDTTPVPSFASVAFTLIAKAPVCVGIPNRTPLAARLIPDGSAPVSLNVIVPKPPVRVNVAPAYATPAVPEAILPGPTVIVGQLITRLYDAIPEQPLASVALTVMW